MDITSVESSSVASLDGEELISKSWIIGYITGGRIISLDHLTDILKSRFSKSKINILKRRTYLRVENGVVELKLGYIISFNELRSELDERQYYLVFYC